jgi:integrase
MARRQGRRRLNGGGTVRLLRSGKFQARYTDEDGTRRNAPVTFETKADAVAWLDDTSGHDTEPVKKANPLFGEYADAWLGARELKPRTRALYGDLLNKHLRPTFGPVRISRITPDRVRAWYAAMPADKPTQRAHAYGLLRSIFSSVVSDGLVDANPCRIRGAGAAKKRHQTKVASLDDLDVIVAAMPERYRPMVLLAAWCGLRFGELVELRRADVDLDASPAAVRVSRAAVRVFGGWEVGDPKSEAGKRTVAVPPHIVRTLTDHLDKHVGTEPGALLFPSRGGGHMQPASLYRVWYPARDKAGRPDLRFHDLRHTGLTMAAATGATLADLMARAGHSSPQAALRYQHAAADRDAAIAEMLSGYAADNVVRLRPKTRTETRRRKA